MASAGPSYSGSVFRKDFPVVIATNRIGAILLPVALRYNAAGVIAGTILARNTTDGLFDTYVNGGASGTGTAACILFESHPVEDFSAAASSGSTPAVGIFGGCTVFKTALPNVDATAETSLGAKEITDSSGVTLLKF